MATTYATDVAGLGTTPPTKVSGAVQGGRLRRFRAVFTMAAQAAADNIVLAAIPAGYTFAFGVITSTATMGATATVAIGVAGNTGKYRTAATYTAVETPTLFGKTPAMDDVPLAAAETVLATIAAASLPGAGVVVIDLFFSAP